MTILDTRLIRDTMGWRPRVGLEDGLARTVRWHLARREGLRRAGVTAPGRGSRGLSPGGLSPGRRRP
ncbi:hypothetical protein OPKNFCMD_1067 [Methylobacterium crusticola]|uniref:NAD(P)-binding domain-containing protein n=1 Tax=Methylobacterium crusticola TaxID=1697972 RepID=A0ABQ4QUH2_9HYPH|nr:hypothetical protein [Methylobacterium crusticola]GJD48349.1 hypothetical protein OPKNFCMD_1067 [Methylobacterium crusticola]